MKIGDLVRCVYVDDKPIGIVIKVRWASVGNRVYDVFVNNSTFPFRPHTVEIVNESR